MPSKKTRPTLEVHWKTIIRVKDFRYLGSMMALGASDLKRLIRMVHTLGVGMPVEEPITTTVKLFNTICVTILLYGMDVNPW